MRVLCVAEKPSIAKSIVQILSGGQYNTRASPHKYIKNYDFNYHYTNSQFTVTSVLGHLLDHDFEARYSSWHSCDPFVLFDAPVLASVKKDFKPVARNLENEARRADTLMIWTDCDREGENIGAEIAGICKEVKRGLVVRRARFSAIIAQQIHNAAQHPVNLDMAQANAVEARTILDLRIGAAFTRMQTLTLQARFRQLTEVMSYGPCQFPTLGFTVSRYNQVKAFRPETFWYIFLAITAHDGSETPFTWRRGHLFDVEVAIMLYQHVLEDPRARVSRVTHKDTKKWKPLPLTTVDLQKAGSRLLKISPKKVLDIAEHLYQQGFLSYPRTETDQYDPQFDFMTLIGKQTVDPGWGQFATGLQNGQFTVPRRGKRDDKAHPPIHPTAHAGNLAGDEKRVYEYITRRFLASCSKDALGWETTVEVLCGGEEFSTSGLMVKERNYLDVFPYDKWSDKQIPNFEQGQEFMPSVCELKEGQTTRPNLLTEADLVSLMDKNGIGTDATIAQHIQTIIDRKYVIERMQGTTKYLVPSTLGIGLVDGYNEIGFDRSLSRPELRRETERQMVQVCEGEKTKNEMLQENVEKYKDMFMRTKTDINRLITCVGNRIQDNEIDYEADFLDIAPGGNGGGRGNGVGRGRVGRGGRARGRGGAVARRDDDDDDSDGNDDDLPRGRGTRGRSTTRARVGASTSTRGGRRAPPPPPPPPPAAAVPRNQELDDDELEAFLLNDNPPPAPRPSQAPPRPPIIASRSLPAQPAAPPVAPPSRGRPPNSTTKSITCECGVQAVTRTVLEETNNKGRRFYCCGDEQCGFFKWADDRVPVPSHQPAPPPRSRTFPAPSAPREETAEEKECKCEPSARAAMREVSKAGPNHGRHFWTCRKPQGSGCGFFEWADEGGGGGGGGGGGEPRAGGSGAANNQACFKCGEMGHWANACTNAGAAAFPSRGSGATRDNPDKCFKCGKQGHYSSACTAAAPKSTLKRTASRSASRGTTKRARGRGTKGRGGRRKSNNFDAEDMDEF